MASYISYGYRYIGIINRINYLHRTVIKRDGVIQKYKISIKITRYARDKAKFSGALSSIITRM